MASARFYLHDGQAPLDRAWIAIDFADHTTITVDTDASGWTPVVTGPAGTWDIRTAWQGDPQPDPARPGWECWPSAADYAEEQVPANASLEFRYVPTATPEPYCAPKT